MRLRDFSSITNATAQIIPPEEFPARPDKERFESMKATGIVRRIDDLGRVVIPKEIRRTMRIREGDPLLKTLTAQERGIRYITQLGNRLGS